MSIFDDGLGGIASKILGSKNKFRATAPELDPSAYQYGGQPGGADEAANRYRAQAEGAQGRQGVQANYGQANVSRGLGMQARNGQSALASAMYGRATGAVPSIAQMQAQRDMAQAAAAQSSAAASARGAAGLALAQQNAAGNTANAQSAISGQAQINAANERLQAEQAASGAYANLRGGDLNQQTQDANQATTQAGFADAQRARNDAMTAGMTNAEMGVRNSAMTGRMNEQAQRSGNSLQAQGINAGVSGQNANMNQVNGTAVVNGIVDLAKGGAGAALGVPGKARGGPTQSGKPYLVGEQGPELIVPERDGYVLTAEQTQRALNDAPAKMLADLWGSGRGGARASLASVLGKLPAREPGGPVKAGGETAALDELQREKKKQIQAGIQFPRSGAEDLPTYGGSAPADIAEGRAAPSSADNESELLPSGWQAAPSTWGQPTDEEGQRRDAIARQRGITQPYDDLINVAKEQKAKSAETWTPINKHVAEIDERDKDAVWNGDYKQRHGQAMSPEEEGQYVEARYRQGLDKSAAKKRSPLANALGRARESSRDGQAIDTSLHLPGYAPTALIPLRAAGGPTQGGQPFIVGEQGPELIVPPQGGQLPGGIDTGPRVGVGGGVDMGSKGYMSAADINAASSGLMGQQMRGLVGGGGITGGAVHLGRDGSGGGGAMYGGAREDGGHVKAGTSYLVGERGPELIDARESGAPGRPIKESYDTQLSPAEEKGYAEWKKQYAPNDSGADYDLRGAFRAGEKSGADGHWVDTWKKPNHPTFSNQSKYAVGRDAAKAGRWDGDRFVPPSSTGPRQATGGHYDGSPEQLAKAQYLRETGQDDASVPQRAPAAANPFAGARSRASADVDDGAAKSEAAAKLNAQDAAQALLTQGPGAAAIPASAGLANFLDAWFRRRSGK